MANQTAKQVDALGFDRMEIANVRRCYMANKVNYKNLNKLYEKAAVLKAQIDNLKAAIDTWDAPVHQLSESKLGVILSSEEIMIAHEDIEKFYELHPEMRPAEAAEETPVAEEAPAETEDTDPFNA